jgi:hypothetical protein
MKQIVWCVALLVAPAAAAEEPATAPVAVRPLEGCWRGTGSVMGKPVTTVMEARPVALGAMLVVDADSVATTDAADRYAAHLVFGSGKAPADVIGFWSDSFGGNFTATGAGAATSGGFDISYRYPDAEFVNRWRIAGDQLGWTIVARDEKGKEQPFASYTLRRAQCPAVLGKK